MMYSGNQAPNYLKIKKIKSMDTVKEVTIDEVLEAGFSLMTRS